MLPNFRIMQKKDCSFRIYQNIKITHADSDHPFLAITQNWAMRLFVGFVMQGHNYPKRSCIFQQIGLQTLHYPEFGQNVYHPTFDENLNQISTLR